MRSAVYLGYICISMNSAYSPTFPSLHLRHNSFSNPSVALPTSQLILHPFRCFTYVTAHSPTLLSLLLRHKLFNYVTWRAAHDTLHKHYFNIGKIGLSGSLKFDGGRRMIGICESLIWSKTLMKLIFNPCGEFRWSSEGPVSQIHSHLHVGAPGIFSDFLRSFQMLKREWGAESNGKLPHLFNSW